MARIIAIEDSPALQRLLHFSMRGSGFDVESYVTGGDGLAAAKQNPPSVIILDLGLPDRSGWDVLEELRTHTATRETPVIVTSGAAPWTVAERSTNLNAVALEKPYTVAALRATVESLGRERLTPASGS